MKVVRIVEVAGGGLVSLALAAFAIGCGGAGSGGNAGGGPPPPPSPPPSPPQLSITTGALPLGVAGTPYSVQLTAEHGSGALTWSASPSMPSGLTLISGGLISGTPSAESCGSTLTLVVTDSSTPPQKASVALRLGVAALASELRMGQVGVYYVWGFVFDCSTDPVSWSLLSGSLPPGLQMTPFPGATGQLDFTGTPTQAGTFPLTVQATDGSNRIAQISAVISVIPRSLKITDGWMLLGVVTQAFDHTPVTTGGTLPYSFSVSMGALAPGLQLNANTGEISGTPTTAGLYQFNLTATDATVPDQFTFVKPYSMLVTAAPLPARNDSLANATPIVPGTYVASLSPYTDAAGNAAPDQDYYVMTGNVGEVYVIGVGADCTLWQSVNNPGGGTAPTDPALEILDGTGTRMMTCNDPVADNPPAGAPIAKGTGTFTDACINHGASANPNNAYVTIQLPPGSNQQIYIHVFDFEGRARPDFIYSLDVEKK